MSKISTRGLQNGLATNDVMTSISSISMPKIL